MLSMQKTFLALKQAPPPALFLNPNYASECSVILLLFSSWKPAYRSEPACFVWIKIQEESDIKWLSFTQKLLTLTKGVILNIPTIDGENIEQSCKSSRAFRVGFGPGSGLKLTKILDLNRAWDELFVLGAQIYNQDNLTTLLNFSSLT